MKEGPLIIGRKHRLTVQEIVRVLEGCVIAIDESAKELVNRADKFITEKINR